jgi:hypothetical protein
VLVPGALLLGAMTAVCWCFLVNAMLDASLPRPVPASIVAKSEKIDNVVVRTYEIVFRLEESAQARKRTATAAEFDALALGPAVAWVRAGRLGWPWIEKLATAEPER